MKRESRQARMQHLPAVGFQQWNRSFAIPLPGLPYYLNGAKTMPLLDFSHTNFETADSHPKLRSLNLHQLAGESQLSESLE